MMVMIMMMTIINDDYDYDDWIGPLNFLYHASMGQKNFVCMGNL